ncbi:Eco57I restriction-modification methylase domain-containing protein [Haliscomenobacter hydrossis]|uniref:site-specific DNA-methyltransferase (adenine-specific) n=1 Tax=Haliscomenobacter hydrossis (strain ATCC 27775 / DSM 1100 / LMG 10767 / O) TaxID=760192 RepID=F4L7Z5_HALH1|nr:hypothetical protein [Haliscomenobacter hydrossis]AEE54503.1 hypothetical protein Halhy_6687 [Haliscomenobacter hydrossis DSM 1100]
MAALTPPQRSTLESAVKLARKQAETGALNALQALAVNHPEPFVHLSPAQRALRNMLRAKARLLGDGLDGPTALKNLSHELAYETWHKMLFAKFLEANHLLMHPDGVAVTMTDCEELAAEEGFADKWDTAASYASRMLPAIFRPEDPLMQVPFASNDRIKLEQLIDGLDASIFTADDALGWVYQFWQSEAKERINKSGDKIDGEKLPAVTQLFTEPYMVHFLIDNTLGAWWLSRHPGQQPPLKFAYLRCLEDGRPAAGQFAGWPDSTAAVTALDPCMGSGHFVAALFPVFATLRMHEEGLSKTEATLRVIAENLHGLELDPRCTQIAAFNLALTAWKFCGQYLVLPEMNLACSGIAPKGKVEDWVKLVGQAAHPVEKNRLENGMRTLYQHFQLAPELGSLLDPTTIKPDAFTASFQDLKPVLEKALENEADAEQWERGVMAAGIAKAGQLLGKKYTLQITNVPYLSRGKQDTVLADYCERNYPEAKGDLATVFLDKMLKSNTLGGFSCSVIPQNWLFLTSYKKFREKLLKNKTWNIVARLGAKGFQTPMWDFNVMLIAIAHQIPTNDQTINGLDVSEAPNAAAKDEALKTAELKMVGQVEQLGNPDARVVLEAVDNYNLLNEYCSSTKGISTSDDPVFIRSFWERKNFDSDWEPYQTTPKGDNYWSGYELSICFQNGNGRLRSLAKAMKPDRHMDLRGQHIWTKKGVSIGIMSEIPAAFYLGNKFDANINVIIPNNEKHYPAIFCYCNSNEFKIALRKIDQKISVTTSTFAKVPFDLEHWQKVAAEKYPDGLPLPYSDDPTQWLFHGHPLRTTHPLQVALARLLGYRWPAENDPEMELAPEARALIAAVQAFDPLSDEDGIFCIPSVNAEAAGADRLRDYLQVVFGDAWNHQSLSQLLAQEGASASNLEDWLRNEYFSQHCKLFQNRPFIWHIWDGRKDGFAALVNYHQLDKDNLSKLIYTYLGDWIRMCEAKKKAEESGAEGLLSAALKLKTQLEAILEGEAPYDVFVRWKPLEQQPLGWDPDPNDGVRLNIRPFVEAGVLRSKFNLKWGVDRGKNPPGAPWGEVRDNDRHLRLEEKREAREKVGK